MTPQTTPLVAWTLRAIVFLGVLAALGGCTIVDVDPDTGRAHIATLMTSRQDVRITRSADGAITWEAGNSNADAVLAKALLNTSAAAARLAGAPVAP